MPNKNSIESEIKILVNSVCSHAIPRPEAVSSILTILQREVKKGRVEELKMARSVDSQFSSADIVDHLESRLEELENDS